MGEAAARGKDLFETEEAQCSTCHIPPVYSDLLKHDVGTGEDPGERKGTSFDTPSLRGIYKTEAYLHHGFAETLLDVLTTQNPDDLHGKTSHLDESGLSDLVAFLNSIGTEAAFEINAGLNDAWVTADAPFQGMFITVFPVAKLIFLAWFTFDSEQPPDDVTAVFGAPDQRWVTAVGSYAGSSANLKAELTSGGKFNASDPHPTQDTDYGTIDINFSGCNSADVDFDFPSAGEAGSFTMNRVLSDNVPVCEGIVNGSIDPAPASSQLAHRMASIIKDQNAKSESAAFTINSGLNDAWVHADANFQGMFLTVFPEFDLIFAAWFTFDTEDNGQVATFGAPDHRWLTALGSYSGTTASLELENTTGGSFNSTVPTPTQDTDYGSMDIDFTDCNNATVTYNIPGATQTGTFTMNRVLDDNVGLCEALSIQ